MIKPWWWLSGWGPARDAEDILVNVEVCGGRAITFRRMVRIGPFGFYVVRYGPERS